MSADDDRTRRRLGDETKNRIADLASGWDSPVVQPERPARGDETNNRIAELASGWTVDASDTAVAPDPAPEAPVPVRKKQRTVPPPPPGSPERHELEARRATGAHPVVERARPPTGSHPVLRPRSPTGSQPALRPRTPTGSQRAVEPEFDPNETYQHSGAPVPAARERPPTGSHAALRPRSSTGSQPALRPRSATGSQPTLRPRTPTGSQQRIDAGFNPNETQPHSGAPTPGSARGSTAAQPIVRSKGSTGAQPVVGPERGNTAPPPPPPPAALERSKPTTVPPPHPHERTKPTSVPPPPPLAALERSKPTTVPPPSPHERTKSTTVPPPPRTKSATVPPVPALPRAKGATAPPVPPRAKAATVPPIPAPPRAKIPTLPPPTAPAANASSGPRFKRAGFDGPAAPFSTDRDDAAGAPAPRTTASPAAASGTIHGRSTPRGRVVPVGEFDDHPDPLDDRTVRREPSEALIAETLDHTGTEKFERADPTQDGPPDATAIERAPRRVQQLTSGTLRRTAALRRKRGLAGDVRYVFTAVFGVRRSRRELAELEHRQKLRHTSRRRHLVTLGRSAAVMEGFDHPALGKAREQLAAIEDERSKHAGAVAASDAELERVRRDRELKAKQHVADASAADAELAELAKKLEPLEKEAIAARKRAQEHRDELLRVERKLAETEALLTSVKAEKMDKAAIHADIATLKANMQAVLRDEPVIASELDALNPRLAAHEASRAELTRNKAEIENAEQEDQRRTLELLEAIGAKRKVVERAAADAEAARDNALFALGERLYVDRPFVLTAHLSPIDRIDLELGEDGRRAMELKEILSSIDKAKFARGLALIILVLGAAGSFLALVFHAL